VTTAKRTRKKATPIRLSPHRQPSRMAPEAWQRALRRQFGREQGFGWRNLGAEPVFSDFAVDNPATQGHYRVTIRGQAVGDNRCTCPDYATNDLGTCKHIEFVLGRLLARRGAKAAFTRGFVAPYSELWLHRGDRHQVRWRAGSDCPPRLLARAGRLFDAAAGGALREQRLAELPEFIAAAQAAGHDCRVDDEVFDFIAQARDAERRAQTLDAAYPGGAADPALRSLLRTALYPYQAEGAWFAARTGRALIADEMGLGKTVQAIAAAELMARHFGVRRVMVVCPTSLKHQWQRELERFAGRDARIVGGNRAVRARQYAEDDFCKIVNYDSLARDLDLIEPWSPELLIVDEAQRVKNWATQAARALRRIGAPHVIVLTGTPLENRLDELIAVVQLVDQHRLGPTWRLRHDHQRFDEVGRVVGYRDLDRIGRTLAPIMLRRRKTEVLAQLPERIDKTLMLPLTPQQRVHHDDNAAIVGRIVQRWRRTGYLSDVDQRRLQIALQRMRMACNSTWLLDRETDYGTKADELVAVLEELFEQPDAKAVVFSQWLGTHEVLQRRIEARGWDHVLFHGGVPAEQRGALVDRFTADPACRLFLSTDSGGVGLNLQHAAATVVNMDLPWNPAVLEQRVGRVYRLGQRRGVQVINLVAEASIEHGMQSVLAFKRSLFDGVLDGGAADVFMQGTRLTQFMETVDAATAALRPEAAAPADRAASTAPDAATPAASAPAEPASANPAPSPAPTAPVTGPPAADPWAPLIDAGIGLLRSLGAAGHGEGAGPVAERLAVEIDPTGRRYVRLPLPDPAAIKPLADALAGLLANLRR
jgi:superfamily II DNA or RNA helicase